MILLSAVNRTELRSRVATEESRSPNPADRDGYDEDEDDGMSYIAWFEPIV